MPRRAHECVLVELADTLIHVGELARRALDAGDEERAFRYLRDGVEALQPKFRAHLKPRKRTR